MSIDIVHPSVHPEPPCSGMHLGELTRIQRHECKKFKEGAKRYGSKDKENPGGAVGICTRLCSPVAKGKREMRPPARPGPQSQARSFEHGPCCLLTLPWTNHLLANLRLIVDKRGIKIYHRAGRAASRGGASRTSFRPAEVRGSQAHRPTGPSLIHDKLQHT